MKALDRKQKDLLSEIISKIVIYLTTIALIKQIIDKEFNVLISAIILVMAIILTIIAVRIVKEEDK